MVLGRVESPLVKCSFEPCSRLVRVHRTHNITKGFRAGGHECSSIVGLLVCNLCYRCFSRTGSLTLRQNAVKNKFESPLVNCSFGPCGRLTREHRTFNVTRSLQAGEHDSSSAVGHRLCSACYMCYSRTGNLTRSKNVVTNTTVRSVQQCFSNCSRPAKNFHTISGKCQAGGQDWSLLKGKTVCSACYHYFQRNGHLQRKIITALEGCSYKFCLRPNESSKYKRIDSKCQAGGRNWSELVGKVLCNSCFTYFCLRGTLERQPRKGHMTDDRRQCTHADCQEPNESPKFYGIGKDHRAWGRDWSEVRGAILCESCYLHFSVHGTLKKINQD